MCQITRVGTAAGGGQKRILAANFGETEVENVGESRQGWKVNPGASDGVYDKEIGSFVKDYEPTVGRAAEAFPVRRFWEVEEVEFVFREAEEGSSVVVVGSDFGEHEPGELTGEVVRGFEDRGSPAMTDGSESEVVNID